MGLGRVKGGEGKRKNKEQFTDHLLLPAHWLKDGGGGRHSHGALSARL